MISIGYREELVYVDRKDGLMLEGALFRPFVGNKRDAIVLCFHDSGSRFYDLPYVQLGREMAASGYAFASCNTHSHDVISMGWNEQGEMTPGGSMLERFEECLDDIDAWVCFARSQGYESIVLMGHSYGANKVVYYASQRHDNTIAGIIAASPDTKWRAGADRIAAAERMVEEGRGDELLPAVDGSPVWQRVSAHSLLSRARIAQHVFDSPVQEPFVGSVEYPMLAFYGTNERWLGGPAELKMIWRNASASRRVSTRLIEGADHSYWGYSRQVAGVINEWLENLDQTSRVYTYQVECIA